MVARLAYAYVRLLLALELLLLFLTVVLNVDVLLGAGRLYAGHGRVLFYTAFGMAVPVFFLAKERNVWKNEFMACPMWLRIATVALMVYGFIVGFLGDELVSANGTAIVSSAWGGAAMPLFFEGMSLVVLYAWASSRSAEDTEFIKRVRLSAISLVACLAFVVSRRLGYWR